MSHPALRREAVARTDDLRRSSDPAASAAPLGARPGERLDSVPDKALIDSLHALRRLLAAVQTPGCRRFPLPDPADASPGRSRHGPDAAWRAGKTAGNRFTGAAPGLAWGRDPGDSR